MPTLTILPFEAVTLTWMSPRLPASDWSLPTTVWAPLTLALPVVRPAVDAACGAAGDAVRLEAEHGGQAGGGGGDDDG